MTKTPSASKPARSKTRAASTRPVTARKIAADMQMAADKNVASPPEITKKELIDRMMAQTGMKKGEARRALEASLDVLGGALREGRGVAAAPLGKVKIARSKETANGTLVVCRIKLKTPGTGATAKSSPLAPISEDG